MNATYAAGAPPAEIDPEILSNMTITDFGGYAPNTKKTRRYQFEDTRQQANRSRLLAAPKFLSERARDLSSLHSAASSDEIVDAFEGIALDESTKKGVPVVYRKVEIKYSKFGVDDFDFKYEMICLLPE